MSKYRGRKAFITGGSKGIGRCLAIELARRGADVFVCARGQAALDETLALLREAGGPEQTFGAVSADVTDRGALDAAAATAIEAMGGVDLLIANSGVAQALETEKADLDHYRWLMDVNFFGHVNTVQAFLPHFTETKRGDIVLVSSVLAVLSVYGYGGYSASKFAIRGFAEALRQEMLLKGVRVKLFLPPTTDTPGLEEENKDKPPITKAMEMDSSLNKTHPPMKVVEKMLEWLPNRKFIGYATFDSWFQYAASRHLPELTMRIADGEMRGAIKKIGR